MQIRIVAVGQRITEWAQSAVSDYLSRFPRDFRVELREIRTEPRAGQTPARLMAAEAERILAAIAFGRRRTGSFDSGLRPALRMTT